jgi:hypothetical protein
LNFPKSNPFFCNKPITWALFGVELDNQFGSESGAFSDIYKEAEPQGKLPSGFSLGFCSCGEHQLENIQSRLGIFQEHGE